jgi:hypothetical protein
MITSTERKKNNNTTATLSVSSISAVQELKSKQFALTIFHSLSSSTEYTAASKNINDNQLSEKDTIM